MPVKSGAGVVHHPYGGEPHSAMSYRRHCLPRRSLLYDSHVSRGSLDRIRPTQRQRLLAWSDSQGVAGVARDNSLLSIIGQASATARHAECNAPPILASRAPPITNHLTLFTFHFSPPPSSRPPPIRGRDPQPKRFIGLHPERNNRSDRKQSHRPNKWKFPILRFVDDIAEGYR